MEKMKDTKRLELINDLRKTYSMETHLGWLHHSLENLSTNIYDNKEFGTQNHSLKHFLTEALNNIYIVKNDTKNKVRFLAKELSIESVDDDGDEDGEYIETFLRGELEELKKGESNETSY